MSMDLSGKTLGIIHASHITIQAMEPYIREYIPEVEIMHLCDDTIQRELHSGSRRTDSAAYR